MNSQNQSLRRPVDLSDRAGSHARQTFSRGLLRRCPYCGGGDIFSGWFTLKEHCPHCQTSFAIEDGYFLGSYSINLGLTSIIAIAAILWMIIWSDMSVVSMQISAVALAVLIPLFLYPYSLSLWMMLDLVIHPPGDFSRQPRS
jgi:uncharacterized protein (DUF983 family)